MDPMSIAAGAAGPLIGGVMGLIGGNQDEKQIEQQRRLTEIQLAADKNMFNYSLTRTNVGAQAQQLKAAGMNPALAMKGGGASGQGVTASKGGEAANSAQREAMGLQRQMMGAQMAEILSQAQKNKAEAKAAEASAAKTAGVDTDVAIQSLSRIAAETNESVAKRELLGIEADVNRMRYSTAAEDLNRLRRENKIGDETYNSAVMAIRYEAAGRELENELNRAKIDLTEQQRVAIQQGVLQKWQELKTAGRQADAAERNAATNEIVAGINKERPTINEVAGKVLKNGVNSVFRTLDKIDEAIGMEANDAFKENRNIK